MLFIEKDDAKSITVFQVLMNKLFAAKKGTATLRMRQLFNSNTSSCELIQRNVWKWLNVGKSLNITVGVTANS